MQPSTVMRSSAALRNTHSLQSMPCDVLSHLALVTVSLSAGIPTPREITTVIALTLTCCSIHYKLSLSHNPHLYADIFRLMFDIAAIRRRVGAEATASSALTSELEQRVKALKRIKVVLDAFECEEASWDVISTDLMCLFIMMTENDGKNRYQLINFVDVTRISGYLVAYASRTGPTPSGLARKPDHGLIIALMWMSSHGESSSLAIHPYFPL